MPNLRNGSKGGIWTQAHLIASPAFYRWATVRTLRMNFAIARCRLVQQLGSTPQQVISMATRGLSNVPKQVVRMDGSRIPVLGNTKVKIQGTAAVCMNDTMSTDCTLPLYEGHFSPSYRYPGLL